ncbi:hypothetical protein ALI22I_20135 [Saccharothrix sp. ALI-22-I]|uniref:hypothetical protein n=1 Tax=Saccharothrix sp. ALI-22-I TaxID=1933778 RepID=UPI00097C93EB|nr:hypothetical protein [Saccharothrix sp. ALI-22-I]ONI88052.1 hypothetical protein ALI22I_20135 [Saccharothrix sp. ALI-22-I]
MSVHTVVLEFTDFLSQIELPDPEPMAPEGPLADGAETMLAWMKWGGLVGAVGCGMWVGIAMIVGRRNRNNMAIEGALGIPWIVGGVAMVLGAASFVGFFVS